MKHAASTHAAPTRAAQVSEANLRLLATVLPDFMASGLCGAASDGEAPPWRGLDEMTPFWLKRSILNEHRFHLSNQAPDLRTLIFDSVSPKSPEVTTQAGGAPALFLQAMQHFRVQVQCSWARLPKFPGPASVCCSRVQVPSGC